MYLDIKDIDKIKSEKDFALYVKEHVVSKSDVEWAIGTDRGRQYLELLKHLGTEFSNALVLDIGCGYGGVSLFWSDKTQGILAVDLNKNLLRIVNKRAKNTNRSNVVTLNASGTNLPLKNNLIDTALLIGVLEWIPYSKPFCNPEKTQRLALGEIKQKLKKDGTLLIAIENRYYLGYWLGRIDQHSSLRFVPILPRFIADLACRLIKGEPYFFNRTYSYRELKKLLRQEGFSVNKAFVGIPSYTCPRQIADISNKTDLEKKQNAVKQSKLSKTVWRLINSLGLTAYLCSNFIVVCQKVSDSEG